MGLVIELPEIIVCERGCEKNARLSLCNIIFAHDSFYGIYKCLMQRKLSGLGQLEGLTLDELFEGAEASQQDKKDFLGRIAEHGFKLGNCFQLSHRPADYRRQIVRRVAPACIIT